MKKNVKCKTQNWLLSSAPVLNFSPQEQINGGGYPWIDGTPIPITETDWGMGMGVRRRYPTERMVSMQSSFPKCAAKKKT